MFVVFDHGADVFRMDTETGETWQLIAGIPGLWRKVHEEPPIALAELSERLLRES